MAKQERKFKRLREKREKIAELMIEGSLGAAKTKQESEKR